MEDLNRLQIYPLRLSQHLKTDITKKPNCAVEITLALVEVFRVKWSCSAEKYKSLGAFFRQTLA